MAYEKTLKMKFKLNQLEFELEGAPEDVKEQYNDFKSFVLNDLMPKVNFADRPGQPQPRQPSSLSSLPAAQDVEVLEPVEIPSLRDVKLRDLPKTEPDWLVVYCYFASENGAKEFTRDDISQLYKESDRHTRERNKNLSNYIKSMSKADYIKATNNTHFIILPKGREKALQIFTGQAKAASPTRRRTNTLKQPKGSVESQGTPKSVSRSGSKKFDFELDRSLNLRPDGKPSLKQFAKDYQMDSSPKAITVIVHYLTSVLKMGKVTGDHIYTALEELGGKIPPSLKQIIVNTKGRRYAWLDYESIEDIRLSIQGKNALKDELLNK